MTSTQPSSIRLTDRLRRALKAWAADENRSFAAHCAWLLEQAVRWREATREQQKTTKK